MVIHFDLECAMNYSRIQVLSKFSMKDMEEGKYILRQEKTTLEDMKKMIMMIYKEKMSNPDQYRYKTGKMNEFGKEIELFEQIKADKVDGIIATRDVTAAGIINAAVDAGVSIPDDLEIISAASTNVAKIVRPQLTTVQQPLYDIGAVAMRMLTKLMSDEELDEAHVILPYTLKQSRSTK